MSDYISREDVLALADDFELTLPDDEIFFSYIPVTAVEKLTAADVAPVVRAHWYWDKDGIDWNIGAWRCSACEAMSPMWWSTDRGSPMHKSVHKYCPNCGARMDGEE